MPPPTTSRPESVASRNVSRRASSSSTSRSATPRTSPTSWVSASSGSTTRCGSSWRTPRPTCSSAGRPARSSAARRWRRSSTPASRRSSRRPATPAPARASSGSGAATARRSSCEPAARRSSGVLVVLEDVSELRRLQQIRAEFVDNLSHELRTPLSTISLLAETLARDADSAGAAVPPKMRDRITKIEVETGHLVQMVNELLDLARIESGGPLVLLDDIDIGRVAARVRRASPALRRAAGRAARRRRSGRPAAGSAATRLGSARSS